MHSSGTIDWNITLMSECVANRQMTSKVQFSFHPNDPRSDVVCLTLTKMAPVDWTASKSRVSQAASQFHARS